MVDTRLRHRAWVREHGEDYMGLFTPVLKGYLTDMGFANAVNAQQVLGGQVLAAASAP